MLGVTLGNWGITHGLQIAKTRGIMCVHVESDSAMVINLTKDGYNQRNFLYSVLECE
jgi:ribonuclease HI